MAQTEQMPAFMRHHAFQVELVTTAPQRVITRVPGDALTADVTSGRACLREVGGTGQFAPNANMPDSFGHNVHYRRSKPLSSFASDARNWGFVPTSGTGR